MTKSYSHALKYVYDFNTVVTLIIYLHRDFYVRKELSK